MTNSLWVLNNIANKKTEKDAPIQERFHLIDDLINQNKKKLSRLLELYISGEFDQDVLMDQKRKLEETILALNDEREGLMTQINQSLTDEQLNELTSFSKQIREGLAEANEDFKTRRKLIEYLGVKVTFFVEDGKQTALLFCEFGDKTKLTKSGQTSSHLLELEHSTNSHVEEADNYMSNYKHSMDCRRN